MRPLNKYLSRRNGKYQFVRRVPDDVAALHQSRSIREALNTSDLPTARILRDKRVGELESRWSAYRTLPKSETGLGAHQFNHDPSLFGGVARSGPHHGRHTELADLREAASGQRGGEGANPSTKADYETAACASKPMTVAAEEFLARANLKPSTKSLYGKVLKQVAGEFQTLDDISRSLVRQFLQTYSQDRTAKAVRNLIAAARSMLAFHGVDPGVFSGHRIDAGRATRIKGVWTDEEAFRLAHAKDSPQWLSDCIAVALHSGLRRQEICGLIYDAETDQLVVEASRAKTANSVRRIPCHSMAREAAKRLADLTPRLDPQRLTKAMQTLAARLKIPQVIEIDGVTHKRDFHAIRHTFASKLASLRVEESTIAKLLGHAPMNVTGRYAGKVDPEVFRSVVEKVSYW